MTICEPGDVAIVLFPFVDLPFDKPRPAVALSPTSVNERSTQTLFAMITTAQKSAWWNDVVLDDIDSAGLPRPSLVRFKLFTIDNRLIRDKAGVLGRNDRRAVAATARTLIGL